jgi:hypothetical protein
MMAKYGEPGWTDSHNEWLRRELAAKRVPPEHIDRAMVVVLSEVIESLYQRIDVLEDLYRRQEAVEIIHNPTLH